MAVHNQATLDALRLVGHNTELNLSVFSAPVILAGTVDTGHSRGDRSIAVINGVGTFSSVREWHLVHIGTQPGERDVGRFRVKSITGSTTAFTLELDENGVDWQTGYHVTIYRFYYPYAVQNRLWASGGQAWNQFKFYDLQYQNSGDANKFPSPVHIAGNHMVGEITSTAPTVSFAVDLSRSYAMTPGATIASYTITLDGPVGGSVTAFNSLTGIGTIQFTQPGEWWCITTCTDSNGKTEERWRAVKIHDQQDQPYYKANLTNVNTSYGEGMEFTFEAYGNVQRSDIPDSALCLLWRTGDQPADIHGAGNLVCSGYVRSDRLSENYSDTGDYQLTVECSSADTVLDNVPMNDIELRAVANPNAWHQFAPWLYMGAAVHHHLRWHTNMLKITDVFDLNANQTPVFTVKFDVGAIRPNINNKTDRRGIFAKLTADMSGNLYLAEDTQMWNDAARAGLDTVFEITPPDIAGTIIVTRTQEAKVFRLRSGGTQTDVNTLVVTGYQSIIPGYVNVTPQRIINERGSASMEVDGLVVLNQQDSDEKCGRIFARENRDIRDIRITCRGNYTGAFSTIPRFGFYRWGIPDADLSRNLGIYGKNFICRRIELNYDNEGAVQIQVTLEPEVFGPNGIVSRFPNTHPSLATPSPSWQQPGFLKAYMTWDSAFYRDENDPAWEEVESQQDFLHGTVDVWWKFIQNSSNPDDAVYWGVGASGVVDYYQGVRASPVSRTPANSLNDWGEGQTGATVDYIQVLTDPWRFDRKYLLAQSLTGGLYRGWLLVSDTSGASWQYVPLFSASPPTQLRPLWMDVCESHLMVSVWEPSQMFIRRIDAVTLAAVDEYTMGAATISELDNSIKFAFPRRVKDADANGFPFYVAGRMSAPATLTGIHQVIWADDALTWTSYESSWTTSICRSLKVSTDQGGGDRIIYGYRNVIS